MILEKKELERRVQFYNEQINQHEKAIKLLKEDRKKVIEVLKKT